MSDIEHYFNCWWLFWADGFTVGRWVFFRHEVASHRLILHENEHVEQYRRYLVWGLWSIAVPRFWCVYVWQWIRVGFKYRDIPFEIEAREAERD